MPKVNALATNFSAGELSPRLYARVDVAKYNNGCQKLENFITQRFGGIRKRGGTEFIHDTKLSTASSARLVPFIFSVTQAYMLEFGDGYVWVYTNGGIVESPPGTPIEVVTPWNATEIWDLQFVQSADVLYITHPDYAPRTLSRTSATTFVMDEIEFRDGPYLELNDTATTLTPADRASLTPLMTTNTAPSGTALSSNASASAFQVFDGDPGTDLTIVSVPGWVQYRQAGAAQVVVDSYWLTACDGTNVNRSPTSWTVQGSNDGVTWVTLDTRKGESGWYGGETRYYEFANQVAFEYHRFTYNGLDGSVGTFQISEIGFNKAAVSQTAFNLTASSVTGINEGTGFQTTDVGRHIRLLGSDGVWRWAKIAARTSTTVVTVKLYGHALPDLSPLINWRMGAWSDETGWPGCIGFYTGRLALARTATQPQTVWMTVVDDLESFTVSDPLEDDDAITATITSESLNEIKWLAESTDLFIGTSAAIRTIGPTSSAASFSPTNIRQKRETNFGASDISPVRVGTTALYSGYYRKDIREISYSFELNGYVSQDLSILAEHIPAKGVKQIAYAQNPDSVIWMVLDDGSLAGMTYERDQEVIAFHRHVLGGGANVTVESIATIPGADQDEVWMIVNRGVVVGRYVERLTLGLSDTAAVASASFLDSHLVYSGASATLIPGMDHLEGQVVYAWGAAGKQGPYTVVSGDITLGTAQTYVTVGLAYTSTMESLSPEAGAAMGTAQTRLGKSSEVFVRVNRSMGGSIGPSDGTLEAFDYTQSTDTDGAYGVATALYTGDVRVPISMEWGRQKRLKLTHSDPSPFHCLGIVSEMTVSG